jgi:hypothetical protein
VVTAPTLLEALGAATPQQSADRLVELALRGGGPDNVTCIVADVVDQTNGDDRPIIAGAVVEPGGFSDADFVDGSPDSPASRAAKISRDEPVVPVLIRARRHPRRIILPVLILVVVVVGVSLAWSWTQRQYFVGRDGTEVAIFKGVDTRFGPVSLNSVIQNSDIQLADLTQSARSQVISGIIASSRSDADAILARVQAEQLPLCSVASPPCRGS